MRVVLYGEGSTEDRGQRVSPAPNEPLVTDMLGPAHILVARLLEALSGQPRASIQFVAPLRLHTRMPRGSDLHVPKNLWRLLSFPERTTQPDLGIVLVDEDGVANRYRELAEWLRDKELPLPHVIGVPVREFEAWLLADTAPLAAVLNLVTTLPDPESMKPGEAKELLQKHAASKLTSGDQEVRGAEVGVIRRNLAETVSLDRLARMRAWTRFRDDLRQALRMIA